MAKAINVRSLQEMGLEYLFVAHDDLGYVRLEATPSALFCHPVLTNINRANVKRFFADVYNDVMEVVEWYDYSSIHFYTNNDKLVRVLSAVLQVPVRSNMTAEGYTVYHVMKEDIQCPQLYQS